MQLLDFDCTPAPLLAVCSSSSVRCIWQRCRREESGRNDPTP
jgi:hypothetical protein